ncbi:hypothetical protein ILUMI_05540, partial [Ignelater luminosus]
LIRKDRPERGGGIALYIHNRYQFTVINVEDNPDIEQFWVSVGINKIKIALGVIYRPPRNLVSKFLDAFEDTLSYFALSFDHFICLGDFNIDLLDINSGIVAKYLNTIDLYEVTTTEVIPMHHISNHCLIACSLNIKSILAPVVQRSFRNYSNIDTNEFLNDLRQCRWEIIYDPSNVNDKVSHFNANLISLVEVHAPVITKQYSIKPTPWLTPNIRLTISLRDKAYKRAKRSRLPAHWEYYRSLRNYTSGAIKREKRAYLNYILRNTNTKSTWAALERLDVVQQNLKELRQTFQNAKEINDFLINYAQSVKKQ